LNTPHLGDQVAAAQPGHSVHDRDDVREAFVNLVLELRAAMVYHEAFPSKPARRRVKACARLVDRMIHAIRSGRPLLVEGGVP
jgi:hypothetical protein